jgi:metastasis-associated protein MTA
MKTRQAFYLHTTKLTRIARRLCREILRPWHAARHPYMPINSAAIKAECECVPFCPVSQSKPQ